MPRFEGALPLPQPENEPRRAQITSRHTATHGDKLYNVVQLIQHAEELPEEVTNIKVLENHKLGKFWEDKKGNSIGPSDILTLAEKYDLNWNAMMLSNLDYADHVKSVRDADYEKYPLLVVEEEDEITVIDGMHRLTKAWLDEVEEIKIRRFKELPADAEIEKK